MNPQRHPTRARGFLQYIGTSIMNPATKLDRTPRNQLGITAIRAILDLVSSPCLLLDPHGPDFSVVASNDAYARTLGYVEADMVGQGLLDLLQGAGDDHRALETDTLRQSLNTVRDTHTAHSTPPREFRLRLPHTGTEEYIWRFENSPLFDDDGDLQFIVHKMVDVTREHLDSERLLNERRQIEARLAFTEARFSLAFAEAPIGMVLLTPEGRIIEVNQAYVDMLGYTLAELASHDSAFFTHPDDVQLTADFFHSLRTGPGNSGSIEKRYYRKDGQILWARASATMRREAGGTPELVIAIVEDITARKHAEELLRKSQQQLRATYDSTYEYIALLSPDGIVLDCNRASLEFAGNAREDVVGRPFWETPRFAKTPGAAAAVRTGVSRAANGEFIRYEAALTRPSGEVLIFDFSIHPVRNEHGEVVFLVPEGRNITERKQAEALDTFLVGLDDAIRPMTDAQEITQTAARLLCQHLEVNRCAYAEVEEDQDAAHLTGDFNVGVPSLAGRYTFTQFGPECLRLMRAGRPFVFEDCETDTRLADEVESYRAACIRSAICVPLLKRGRVVATLAVHQATPRKWLEADIEIVESVASRCWESIERAHVGRALREREQRYRFLAESIPQMVWTARADGSVDYLNGQGLAYFGLPREELANFGPAWLQFIHPDEHEKTIEKWLHAFATGEPFEIALRLKRASDSAWRCHLVRALALRDENDKIVQWFGTSTDIEDQRQADSNLYQQWRTFDTALSHTPDFTYTFDLSGRFTYVNKALLTLWQKPLAEAVGRNFFELDYPPELAARLQHQIQEVIATGQTVRDQTPYTGVNGNTGHYDYILVPVLDSSGRISAVAGSTRDITAQSAAAQQIEDDRRRWRELLLQTPAAIAVLTGPDHVFEWVNPAYEDLVGQDARDLIGKSVREAMPEVEGQIYISLLNGVYQTGEPFKAREACVRLKTRDGTIKDWYVNFVYLPTRDLAGRVDGIFVHVTDVTDVVLSRKRLEESEQQFRTLAETIPHLAWMADETGNRLWFNRRWYDYTGTAFEDVKGWGWTLVHDASLLPDVLGRWRAALDSGEPFEIIHPLKGGDGSYRMFLTRVEPLKDSTGRVVRWFGTNTDISDQARIEEELRRMNRDLEEFAYVASHDLQEPLRMVSIYTQLIFKNLNGDTDKLNLYSGFVDQSVKRMTALINDLLKFSRNVHNDELPVGTADLAHSWSEALAILAPQIEETKATVETSPLPMVRGDTPQMSHVFQNILSNALKYRRKDVPPKIEVGAKLTGKHWIISVRDNGIGFEPRHTERIFGLFKRLHKEEYPGTGLGLAICKRIVERYGGKMWAEGRVGEGATFYFSLPEAEQKKMALSGGHSSD